MNAMGRLVALMLLIFSLVSAQDYNRYFLVERIFITPFLLKYAHDLGVDEEQIAKIKEFAKETEKEMERNKKILNYLMKKAKLMMLSGGDEKELKEILSDIAYVKLQMSLLNAKEVKFIREVLTEDQFRRLKDIIVVRFFDR